MTRRQRSAYGCIERAGTNRWRVRWWGDRHDGRGYRRLSKTVHGSRRDARLYLSQMETAHHEDRPTMTVGDVFERWYWPRAKSILSKNTIKNYASAWNLVRPKWANRLVTDVRPIEVQEWLLTLTALQAKKALDLLRPLMDYAVRYELIPSNPFRVKYDVNRPSDANGKGSVEMDKGIYTLDECMRIAEAAKGSFMAVPVILQAFASCRVGESLAPGPDDVGTVTAGNGMVCAAVRIASQIDRGGAPSTSVKTEASERTVIVPAPLSMIVAQAAADAKSVGSKLIAHDGLGGGLSEYQRSKEWHRIARAADVERHPLRNLRNSWRTYMRWELGADLEHVEHLMGHVTGSVSDRHYVRPTVEQLTETVANAFASYERWASWDI